ncbi:MAG: hypothetical protein H6525_05100 [Actinobacteria bacterium]|nr:hypothetical protein [Actinomycetota bacterium]MCB9412210.1 hypothetical protein [Actinomycetota bacterium]
MNARTWGGWVIVSAVVGIVVGMAWALAAPQATFVVSDEQFLRVSAQPEEYFFADLLLGVMLALAGFGLALFWSLRGQVRPMASLLGLLTGGVVAMVIAVLVGQGIAASAGSAVGLADGVEISAGVQFRSWAMMVWWPTVVAVVFAVALTGPGKSTAAGDGSGTGVEEIQQH